MPKYKVGERITVGLVEAVVVRGNCESCFFHNRKACMLDKAKCIAEIGWDNCYKVLKEGL